MKFTEKQVHVWVCDVSRGDTQCPYVLPIGDGSYLCCTWKAGHPESLRHETSYDEPDEPMWPTEQWVLKSAVGLQ